MDMGVALVQAYLRVHGYFTVSEYPVLEALGRGDHRTATDIDILATRFPHACQLVPYRGRRDDQDVELQTPDAVLGVDPHAVDMIIGEVKIGAAELNRAATDPAVLRAVLMRFGCCDYDATFQIVETLLREGRAVNPAGHQIRMLAFGSVAPAGHQRHRVVLLRDVVAFLRRHLRDHWEIVHRADLKDPAFSFLMRLEKAGCPSGAGGVS